MWKEGVRYIGRVVRDRVRIEIEKEAQSCCYEGRREGGEGVGEVSEDAKDETEALQFLGAEKCELRVA